MDKITKETTEQIFEAVNGRKFIPEVDAAQSFYVANILERYIKLRLTAVNGSACVFGVHKWFNYWDDLNNYMKCKECGIKQADH